ncbi:type II CAAX prenyl endopeptidase Rce1 family protein [Undibacterium sp. Ji67W]|uniref:CPBP family glutamic-type intramembrane protease n=1 Tax=Undibacterium sp. Ji67W TaxID=3413042 RepID=UPI003BF0C830
MVQQCSEQMSGDNLGIALPTMSTTPSFDWRQEWRELKEFLKKPRRGRIASAPFSQTWRRFLLVFGIDIAIVLFVTLPLDSILDEWAGLESKLEINGKIALYGIVFAPIIEELVFRAGLRKAGYSLFIGPIFVACFAGSMLVVGALATILMSIAVIDKIRMRWVPEGNGRRFARGRAFIRHYPYVFWLYAIGFGLVHLGNFYSSNGRDYLLVFAISAQLSAGFLFAYLRLRQGLLSSILLHSLENGLFFALEMMSG